MCKASGEKNKQTKNNFLKGVESRVGLKCILHIYMYISKYLGRHANANSVGPALIVLKGAIFDQDLHCLPFNQHCLNASSGSSFSSSCSISKGVGDRIFRDVGTQ